MQEDGAGDVTAVGERVAVSTAAVSEAAGELVGALSGLFGRRKSAHGGGKKKKKRKKKKKKRGKPHLVLVVELPEVVRDVIGAGTRSGGDHEGWEETHFDVGMG